MSETAKSGDVLLEFYTRRLNREGAGLPTETLLVHDLADEIVLLRQRADRAEHILAALREPSDEVVLAAADLRWRHAPPLEVATEHIIRAAVAAAEREVDA